MAAETPTAAPTDQAPPKKKGRQRAAKTRIQKAGRGHSYTLDGEKCPGVTTIIKNGVPAPGLIGWAAETVSDFVVNHLTVATSTETGKKRIVADELVNEALAWNRTRERPARVGSSDVLPRAALGDILKNIRYRDLDEASGRGTEVHLMAERLARGEEVVPPVELEGHVDSYVKFLDEWQPTNAILERVVVHRRWRYMGKFDMMADFPGKIWPEGTPWAGRPVGRGLLDIKTARSGVFADNALQLQAYRFAETMLSGEKDENGDFLEEPMPKVDFVAVVHVRADGYSVVGFKVGDNPDTDGAFRCFLYCKQVGDFLDWKDGPAATIRTDSLPAPIERTPE